MWTKIVEIRHDDYGDLGAFRGVYREIVVILSTYECRPDDRHHYLLVMQSPPLTLSYLMEIDCIQTRVGILFSPTDRLYERLPLLIFSLVPVLCHVSTLNPKTSEGTFHERKRKWIIVRIMGRPGEKES